MSYITSSWKFAVGHGGRVHGAADPVVDPTSTWNPADSKTVTFSKDNLTITATANGSGCRSISSKSSGKYYYEYTVETWMSGVSSFGAGLSSAAFSPIPKDQTSILLSGIVNISGSNTSITLGTQASGNTLGIALDIDDKLVWFREAPAGNWNGSVIASPEIGTGGQSISTLTPPLYAWCSMGLDDSVTANFGGSSFIGAVPSGFEPGWP
jgi:hypothetical protein